MRSRLLAIGAVLFLAGLLGSCKRVHEDRAEVRVAYLQIIPSLPVFIAQEQGLFDKENLRLKTIALSSSNALDKIIVKEDSPLHAIGGLRGKKIGVFPGTAPSHMLSAFFKKHGVDPSTISMVHLPPQAQISSLESVAVDALFAYEPVTTAALVHGGHRQLFGSVYADL